VLHVLLIVACVLAGGPAWAHAVLLETQPADGVSLPRGPSQIVLRFNEPVSPVAIRVLDAAGVDRGAGLPRAENNEVRLDLPELPAGGYIVSWRVVSADSHPIGGGSVFSIGAGEPPGAYTPDDASREAAWTVALIVNRFVLYAGLMFAAGGALFAFLVLRPLRVDVAGFAHWRCQAATLAAVAAVAAIGLKGGQLSALPPGALFQVQTWRLGLETSIAVSGAMIVAGLGLIVAAVQFGWRAWVEALGGAIALAGLSATGHAASGPGWVQAVAAAHALLAGFWLGAFWPLLQLIPAHPAATLAAARRFSGLAVPAVLALASSGVAMALSRVADLRMLVGTPYGQLLLIKLLIVAALLVVAAANRWRTTPALAAGERDAPAELARNLKLEIGLGATVLLLTAILAHTPPPGMTDHRHGAAAARGHTVWISQRNRILLLDLVPAARGPNMAVARFTNESRSLVVLQEATIAFTHPAAGVEPIVRPLVRGRDGLYRLGRIELPLAGTWTVRVEALIDDFEKLTFEVEVPVSAPAPRRSS